MVKDIFGIESTEENFDTILPTHLIEKLGIRVDKLGILHVRYMSNGIDTEIAIFKPKITIEKIEEMGGTVVVFKNDDFEFSLHYVDPYEDYVEYGVSIIIPAKIPDHLVNKYVGHEAQQN